MAVLNHNIGVKLCDKMLHVAAVTSDEQEQNNDENILKKVLDNTVNK